MAKIDKSKYTKQEFRLIREQRRIEKLRQKSQKQKLASPATHKITNKNTAFVLGNGTSRQDIDPASPKYPPISITNEPINNLQNIPEFALPIAARIK
jgi:hypothetical protein